MLSKNKGKKLKPSDYEKMWGESGPYSQVRLCEETRILDDSISRIFVVVEAEINPFTFEYVQKARDRFIGDEAVIALLDHAEYRGKFGYVVSAGEVELKDEGARQFAKRQADMAIETLIRMHRFVMDEFALGNKKGFGIMEDELSSEERFVWNETTGMVEAEDGLWDGKTLIGAPAGGEDNKMRLFIVLLFKKNFVFKSERASIFAKTLKKIARDFNVRVEDCGVFSEYLLITALLPFGVTPADFIESILADAETKGVVFRKDYIVTNTKKPTPEEIIAFLGQVS